MLFAIVETHKAGVPLERETVLSTPPVVGKLTISDWREGNAEGRALRVAYLKHPTVSYKPNQLHPLFDPVLVRMTAKGFFQQYPASCLDAEAGSPGLINSH
jgi:hypothetical protein